MGLHYVLTSIQFKNNFVPVILYRKIWDLWFSEGYNAFFKVAMTVF